jgi:hypothetical protein
MLPSFSTCIGVDTVAGRKPFTYVALDPRCNLLAVGKGDVVDVLSFAAGQASALIALSPPSRVKAWKRAQPETSLVPLGRFLGQPQLELDLIQESGAPPAAPAGMPGWLRACFTLAGQLQSIGYCAFQSSQDAPRQWLETQAEAGFHAMLGLPPFPYGTLEGRIQRQLVLSNQELGVPDAMEFFEEITRYKLLHGVLPADNVLPQPELDAWMAAYVAWLACHEVDKLHVHGSAQEGLVYLPGSVQQGMVSGQQES